jgi:hypothetical protein
MNSLAFSKCALRLLVALAAISSLLLTAGCGSSGITKTNNNGYSDTNFSGTYVISMAGTDVNNNASTFSFFAITGAITVDGKGNIMSGAVDINDPDLGGVFPNQSVTGTYNVSQDGRGTGSLVTPKGTFGVDFVLTSSGHGLITRFDGPNASPTAGSGSGTIDLQGSASQSSLTSLAFSLSGAPAVAVSFGGNLGSFATVGAFALDSHGNITSGLQDFNNNGDSSSSGVTGSALAGSLVLSSGTLGVATLNSSFGALVFDAWVIDSTHLKLIETDALGLDLAGDAFTQSTSFTAGQLAFTLGGFDAAFDPVVAGGIVTTDVNGTLSNGTEDYNNLGGNIGTVQPFTGGCGTPALTGGRCQLTSPAFTNGLQSSLAFAAYPSSGGVLLLEDDNLGLLQGAAYAQSATSFAASDGYGLNLSGININEVDDIAQFNTTSTNITGKLDENDIDTPLLPNLSLSGTYSAPTSGRGSIAVNSIGTLNGTLNLEYYVVDASTVLVIEGDSGQATLGMFQLQSVAVSGVKAQSHFAFTRPIFASHGAFKNK